MTLKLMLLFLFLTFTLTFFSPRTNPFPKTETTLKNQQASIQGLETQIGQLSKLISERPQGSLPSNTKPNLREYLNAISTEDSEGFIAPEPKLMQETMVSKGKSEVSHNKMVNEEFKPRVPYPDATRKDRSDEQFGELTLHIGDDTITLQARNSNITSNIEGHTHEERRLRIEELDEWRAHKPRTHDKPKLRQNKVDTSLNQLKVGDKVLLDAADPHIVTTTPNEEIPLTVLSIFPFGTVEPWPNRGMDMAVRYSRMEAGHDFPKTRDAINPHGRATWPWVNLIAFNVIFKRKENRRTSLEGEEGSIIFRGSNGENSSPSPIVSTRAPRRALPNTSGSTFSSRPLHRLGCRRTTGIPRAHDGTLLNIPSPDRTDKLSVLEFGAVIGLYTEEFKEKNELHALSRHIHFSPSKCYHTLAPSATLYNPSRSKASVLPPSLREVKEHWHRQHPRRLLLMVHVARTRHQPCLFHHPCDSAPDGAASEGGHLHWPLRD
ncbi:hypothetical protein GOBAR_AA04808 [Gossypium barbadense]|uniref:Cupin type-1 domain-containing protein n=1 Tax=Gossypium barbadense TaxID=3634 RepID=A0A2P5YJN6_GOSBA|nr:hypothetical protein GOBAR_AA04808 [Gossypium barbadense]